MFRIALLVLAVSASVMLLVCSTASASRPHLRMHPIREYSVPGGHTYRPDPGPTAY